MRTSKEIKSLRLDVLKKVLLSIAGFDPTAGAGACLDLKVFQSFGYHGMGILTSLTAQNTKGVINVHCPSSRFIREQYRSLKSDVDFSGIKVGMIGCAENIDPIIRILSENSGMPIIIDPVFQSSGGEWLFEKKSIPIYMKQLRGKASLLTPNLKEAELISGIKIENVPDAEKAAQQIFEMTHTPCLVKGGHLRKENIDILYDGKKFDTYKNKKLKTKVHGTGCFLSSTLLCYMAKGEPLDQATSLAIHATHKAMKKTLRIGSGQALFSFRQNPTHI
jgi:hydroxymethylpyrimidine/phosphomethylpyrimidine kinase